MGSTEQIVFPSLEIGCAAYLNVDITDTADKNSTWGLHRFAPLAIKYHRSATLALRHDQ